MPIQRALFSAGRFSVGILLAILFSLASAWAQGGPMMAGDAVVTGFSGFKPIDLPAASPDLLARFFIDTDGDWVPDSGTAIENGIFSESKLRSAPYFGIIIDGIVLASGDPTIIKCMGGQKQEIDEDKIKSVTKLERSLMFAPEIMGLTAESIADIVAYLQSNQIK